MRLRPLSGVWKSCNENTVAAFCLEQTHAIPYSFIHGFASRTSLRRAQVSSTLAKTSALIS